MQKLSLIMGLPGSGKSTYSKNINGLKIHIDDIRKVTTGSYQPNKNNDLVHQVTQRVVNYHLAQGKSIVLDGALLSKSLRAIYIDIGRRYGVDIDLYWIDTDFEKLKNNLIERNKIVSDDRKIDLQYLNKLSNMMEMPTIEEGFSNIFHIN